MSALITSLIPDVGDRFELIRDEIAAIIAIESEHQQVLAAAQTPSLDPAPWELRVFTERTIPWAAFIDAPDSDSPDFTPIVNVAFDNASIIMAGSNLVERQKVEGVYNIDCYAFGASGDDGDGQALGDERAARAAHGAARLVRRIVMAGAYNYLGTGFRKIVARRWVQTITSFQPQELDRSHSIQRVQATRLAMHVEFAETSPQVEGQPLELIHFTAKHAVTGQIYFTAKFGEEEEES